MLPTALTLISCTCCVADRYAAYHVVWPGGPFTQPLSVAGTQAWRVAVAVVIFLAAAAVAIVRVSAGLHTWTQVAVGAQFGMAGSLAWLKFASPWLVQLAAAAMANHGTDRGVLGVATTVLAGVCVASLLPWAAITRPRR